MDQIKSTSNQHKKLLSYRSGTGFLIFKTDDNTTVELEFFIKNGQLHSIVNGKKVDFHFTPEDD